MKLPLTLLLSAALLPAASAQTIVNTGDDLVAIVATALDGDVIEIHSDATFVGQLNWTGKTLTVRAGLGFTPVIEGGVNQSALRFFGSPISYGANFEGLRLVGGVWVPGGGFSDPVSVTLSGTGGVPHFANLSLTDCEMADACVVSGTGQFVSTFKASGCTFEAGFISSGTGSWISSAHLQDSEFFQGIFPSAVTASVTSSANMTVDLERSTIHGGARLQSVATMSILNAQMNSCLVLGDGTQDQGVGTFSNTPGNLTGSCTNVTVKGFVTGLVGADGFTWHNMLVFGNTTDMSSVVAGTIDHSLISDGTFAGLDFNLGGAPMVDADYRLFSCSPGVDAGDNAAPNLGTADLEGAPRIQDNNADGLAVVSVGALETSGGSTLASATFFNGNGTNPTTYSAITLPILGSSYDSFVLGPPPTVLTVVAYDAPAAPYSLPSLNGEVMLAFNPAMLLSYSSGLHSQPLPNLCGLLGLAVSSQGFFVTPGVGGLAVTCLNRQDLVLGN